MFRRTRAAWQRFAEKRPAVAQFIVFTLLSQGITVLQLAMMPLVKWLFGMTSLVDTSFQVLGTGTNADGSTFYIFDYAAGALPAGGGGLAYFLAVQITLLVAQVINFFAQRNIAFKSNSSVWRAATWYAIAYVIITFVAAWLQGFYKAPIYTWMIDRWGATGETGADVVTMIINAMISFFVFFPIFKVIFKREDEDADSAAEPTREPVAA
jgi:cellobiose-specific phosphotransferase system component IIC